MGNILGSWSGMRKYLEKEMLAENLKGRVRYNCTTYVNMDGCRVFEIYIDDKLAKRFSCETVNNYFIENGFKKASSYYGAKEYWDGYWELMDSVPLPERTEYTDDEFCEALAQYRNSPIDESLASDNPIRRMFAILDRRTGNRRLAAIEPAKIKPEWLQVFYKLRTENDAKYSNLSP